MPRYRQLSARWLSEQGHHAEHGVDVGLEVARDHEIWAHAGTISAILITKGEDFVTLFSLAPNGARVVWVRIGNTTRRALPVWFAPRLPEIERSLSLGESLIEIT